LVKDAEDLPANPDLLYQCRHCLTVYDKAYGDELNTIPAGTAFADIDTYICPVCEAGKDSFELMEKR